VSDLRAWAKPAIGVAAVAVMGAGLGAYFGIRTHVLVLGGAALPSAPAARAGAAMAFDAGDGQVVMFGGYDGAGRLLGDTWTWNGSAWDARRQTGPSPRSGAVMAYDAPSSETVLFGGDLRGPLEPVPAVGCAISAPAASGSGIKSAPPPGFPTCHGRPSGRADTWTWAHDAWTHVQAGGPDYEPGSVWMATDAASGHATLVAADPFSSSLHVYQWTGSSWRPLGSSSGALSGRVLGLVTDPESSHLALLEQRFLFACGAGGAGAAAALCPLPDEGFAPRQGPALRLLDWTGSSWAAPLALAGGPAGPVDLVTNDLGRRALVLTADGSTWMWNGTWRRVAGSTPPALSGATATFDAAHRQVVAFGGPVRGFDAASGTLLTDDATWTWDGTSWTLRSGHVPPAPRTTPVPSPAPPLPAPTCPSPPVNARGALQPICPVPPEPPFHK